jgi:hypothetical protein
MDERGPLRSSKGMMRMGAAAEMRRSMTGRRMKKAGMGMTGIREMPLEKAVKTKRRKKGMTGIREMPLEKAVKTKRRKKGMTQPL